MVPECSKVDLSKLQYLLLLKNFTDDLIQQNSARYMAGSPATVGKFNIFFTFRRATFLPLFYPILYLFYSLFFISLYLPFSFFNSKHPLPRPFPPPLSYLFCLCTDIVSSSRELEFSKILYTGKSWLYSKLLRLEIRD